MTTLALTELLGATVYDPSGVSSGRVREVTLAPQEDRSRISSLIVKTKSGNRVLPFSAVSAINGGVRATTAAGEWPAVNGTEGLFLLERDLLDQQVIDVNGRKVVRVNDVELQVDAPKDKDTGRKRDSSRVARALRGCGGTRRGPSTVARCGPESSFAGAAGKNSSTQHSVEFYRRNRDRPGSAGEAEDVV